MAVQDEIYHRFDDPTAHPSRYPPDWDARRKAVYRRDGYQCQECGRKSGPHADGDSVRLHAHHVVPLSHGGVNALSNLTTLCEPCHNRAHEHDITETMHGGGVQSPTDTHTTSASFDDPAFHYFIGVVWLASIGVASLLAALVALPVGALLGFGAVGTTLVFLTVVVLFAARYVGTVLSVADDSGFPFVVPTLLLAVPLYAALNGGPVPFGTGLLAVFGSVSLASRTFWYLGTRLPRLERPVGATLFVITAFGLLGTSLGSVRDVLAIPWVDAVSAAWLASPTGMMYATLAVSLPAVVLAAVRR